MKPGLSEKQRARAIADIRDVVRMPQWRLVNGRGDYVVTGAPVVVDDLSGAISRSLVLLFIVALAVMALTLAVVFRARMRLLPLVVAVAAVALTFGILSLLGASLTMASIGVLPVLIGLGVDYAIQLQTPGPRGRARPPSPPPRPPARPASSCSCSRRCRWCAASGCCSWAASRSRWAWP
jgi:predicted RND superfamily exporter protein